MPRTRHLPEGWKGTFLAHRALGMSIAKAADKAGVSERTVRYERRRDPDFADDLDAATEVMRDRLRDEMWMRGFDRDDKESARILIWLGEHYLPEGRWKADLTVSGADGGPVRVQAGVATLGEVFQLLSEQGVSLKPASAGELGAGVGAELEPGPVAGGDVSGAQDVLAEPGER